MSALCRIADAMPWERQRGESEPRWRAFKVYREMDARSIRDVAKAVGKSYTLVQRWAIRDGWQERVRAWDNHLDAAAAVAQRKEIIAFRKRAAGQLRAKIQTLMLPAVALSRRIEMAGGSPEVLSELTPHQLMKLAILAARAMPAAIRAEALVLGDVTGREEQIAEAGGTEPDALDAAIKASPDARVFMAMAVQLATTGIDPTSAAIAQSRHDDTEGVDLLSDSE